MDKGLEKYGVSSKQRVYDFLVEFISQNGYSPSVREICNGTGLTSTSSVHRHLMQLEKEGQIKTKSCTSRAIKVFGFDFQKVR